MEEFKSIGKSEIRVDGKVKVAGAAQFVDDLDLGANLLYAAVVESPHAHAKILRIDASKALKMPGVVKVRNWKRFSI